MDLGNRIFDEKRKHSLGVSVARRASSCITYAMLLLKFACSMDEPDAVTVPEKAIPFPLVFWRPASTFIKVLLPLPDGPNTHVRPPAFKSMSPLTFLRICLPPIAKFRFCHSIVIAEAPEESLKKFSDAFLRAPKP